MGTSIKILLPHSSLNNIDIYKLYSWPNINLELNSSVASIGSFSKLCMSLLDETALCCKLSCLNET